MQRHLDLSLQESFEHTGLWWLPDDPDKKIGGTLSYSPIDGIHLALLGTFNSLFPAGHQNRFEVEVINGYTSNGIPTTLSNNIQVGYSFNNPGFPQQKLSSDLLAMGRHFASMDELRFAKWRISYENLDDWISPRLFNETYDTDTEGTFEVTIVVKPIDHFDAYINAIKGRTVLTTDMFSGSGATSGEFDLVKEAFFELTPDAKQSYEKFKRWHDDIQNLLSLLMVDSIQSRKIHGVLSVNEEDDFSERVGVSIFPRLGYRPVQRITRWHDMLMTLGDIQDHLATVLENWFEAEHNVRQAIILFLADSNPREVDLDTQFVNIMHALESYHRSTNAGHYLSKEEYQLYLEKMVQAIPEGISSDHRKSLKSRLEYGYQYSQRKRFRELFDSIGADLQELVTNGDKAFIGKVVDTRNYLVHRDETSKGLTLEWPERLYAYRRLRMLMTILFLKHIGFDEDFIYQQVFKNRRVINFIGSQEEEE